MKAINVKGVQCLKKYPVELMRTEEGFLTETQIKTILKRQEVAVARLEESNFQLKKRLLAANPISVPLTREEQAIKDQAVLNSAKINATAANNHLAKMRRILDDTLDRGAPITIQTTLFGDFTPK